MTDILNCTTCPTCHQKKAGRKPKYNSDEERKKAKTEQTNKCIEQNYGKRREEKRKIREEKMINDLIYKLDQLKQQNKGHIIDQVIQQLHHNC